MTKTPIADAMLEDQHLSSDGHGKVGEMEIELATLRATLATRDGEIAELRKAFAELERGAIWSAQTDTEKCPVCGGDEPCSHNFDEENQELEKIGSMMGTALPAQTEPTPEERQECLPLAREICEEHCWAECYAGSIAYDIAKFIAARRDAVAQEQLKTQAEFFKESVRSILADRDRQLASLSQENAKRVAELETAFEIQRNNYIGLHNAVVGSGTFAGTPDAIEIAIKLKASLTAARQETLAAREELAKQKRRDSFDLQQINRIVADQTKTLNAQLTQANLRAETEARLSDRLANDIRHMAQMADYVDPDGSDDRDALCEIECTAEFADKAHKAARNAQQPSRTPAKPHELNASAEGEML